MPQLPTETTIALPRWLVVVGSIAIAMHLAALGIGVLAAPSGPFPSPDGASMFTPPQFAYSVHNFRPTGKAPPIVAGYLRSIKMTHNYHFASNRPAQPAVYFEVRLKDAAGEPLATVKIPEDNVGYGIKYLQTQLAQGLIPDQPVQPLAGEAIPAPGQKVNRVLILEIVENRSLKVATVPEHLIPRDRPVYAPSEWSMLLARTYVRYLCRVHGAASGEFIRHTREPIPPAIIFMDMPPAADAFGELIANFGEFPR
jgi:hypothetical protein